MENLWREMKEWRKHWKLSRFFNVLIFGLAASLFDSGTDFNFVWSLPANCDGGNATDTECSVQDFDLILLSSSCGLIHHKNLERLTYTFIAFPGVFLGFASLQSLLTGLINKCWKGEVHRIVRGIAKAFAGTLEFSLFVGLLLIAIKSQTWVCQQPHLARQYDCFIQGMAYFSATLVVGVKCFATFSHGPESCRLTFKAKESENKFEAALQLAVLSWIYLSSGVTTSAELLSAASSVFFIGKTGVQNFLQRHEEKLSEASILGKICVAASVLPVFLLTTVFKIGAAANNLVDNGIKEMVIPLGGGLPILLLLLLKMCNLLKDLTLAQANHHVISDNLSFSLWPKSCQHGKKIGLAMTVFIFLLHALPGLFLIASPEPATDWIQEWYNTANNTAFEKWTSETGDRIQLASISFLLIGLVAFVLAVCLILFEDKWVAKIVAKFPNQPKEEDNIEEGPPAAEGEIDPKKRISDNPMEDQDEMKKDRKTNASVCKNGNSETGSDLQEE